MQKLVDAKLIAIMGAFAAIVASSPRTTLAQLALVVSSPVDHPVASPVLPRNTYAWNQSSGAWGEFFVEQSLKLRGYQDVFEIKAPGGQGIDRVAIKRDALGNVIDVKFVEVKTHRGGAARLATTRAGRQMSRSWLAHKYHAMRRSQNPNLRNLAEEINAFRKARGISIDKLGELHDVNTRTGQHMIRNSLTGVERSRTSIERQLQHIQRRIASPLARRHAAASLAALDQIRATSRNGWVTKPALRPAMLQAVSQSGKASVNSLQRVVRAAGPLGAAIAVGVESYGAYADYEAYQRGEIHRRQFTAATIGRGGGVAGAAAGAATGAWVGAFGGPAAWATVPIGAGVGGVAGYVIGATAAGAATEAWHSRLDQRVQKRLDQWVINTPYAGLKAVSEHE